MSEKIDILADWFLPEYPVEKKPVRFYTDENNNLKLEILGSLRNIKQEEILNAKVSYPLGGNKEPAYRTILGEIEGKTITLFDSFHVGG